MRKFLLARPRRWPGHLVISLLAFCLITPAFADDSPPPCAIPEAWAKDGVPDPITLAQGTFSSFCAFHLWSWNAFLWMMEDTGTGARFEAFPTQAQTVDARFSRADVSGGAPLRLRPAKDDHPIDEIAQAGTLGLLVAQNHRAIYYSQHVNPRMYEDIVSQDWNSAKGIAETSPDAAFAVGDIELKAAWAIVDDNFQVPGAYTRKAQIPLLETLTTED